MRIPLDQRWSGCLPRIRCEKCALGLRVGEFLDERAEGVGGELRTMKRRGREPGEGFRERLWCDGAEVRERTQLELFGEKRGAGNRGGAAAAKEASFHDAAVFEPGKQLQDVTANRISHFDRSGSAGEFTRVARIAKVIENGFAEHRSQYRNPNTNLQRETRNSYFPEAFFGGKYFFSTDATTT